MCCDCFRMAFAYALTFLVLSHHLLILHSAEGDGTTLPTCPPSFNCGNLGNISFPYSNNTLYPLRGLCTLNCDESVQKIQLGMEESKWYDLKGPIQGDEIRIGDPELETLLQNRRCESFNPISLRNTSYISFTIQSPNITLFKCNKSSLFDEQTAEEFFRGKLSYMRSDCQGYNIYYSHPNNLYPSPIPGPPPPNCSEFQMPLRPETIHTNSTDLFSLLAAEFSLQYHVSDTCYGCPSKGGSCQQDWIFRFRCENKKEGANKITTVFLAAVIPTAGIVIFIVLPFFIIRSKSSLGKSMIFWGKKTENYRSIEVFLKGHGTLAPKRCSFSEVKKMTNNFKVKLGQGGYGSVYKGNLPNGCLAAVKVLNESKGGGEEFINEVASISRTSHVNIVTLLGFCFEGSKRALIYEFLPNGSLEKFIYEANSLSERTLSWGTLFQISVGIARGLEYLHRGCKTRILHFDIKPHNILLDEDFCPKISDFGLAKMCPRKESIASMLGARGTAGYIAPEVFCRNFGGVSHKSDVYSYGMMVMVMVGGRKNIDVGVDHMSEIYFPHWIYKRVEQEEELGLRGIKNDQERESAKKMIVVSLWCIQTNPSDRPSMSRVVEMLEGSVQSLEVPPKPFLSSPSRTSPESSGTLLP